MKKVRRNMPVSLAAIVIAVVGVAGSSAHAALIAYDQFVGYTDGQLSGQGQGFGWAGDWSGNTNVSVSGSGGLTYGSIPVAGGGASTGTDETPNSWVGISRTLAAPLTTSGTYYFGYLIQQPVDGAHHNLLRLQDASADRWAAGGSWNDSAQWQLVRKDGAGAFGNISTGVSETAEVTHFVIKFELGATDTMSLYINPADAAALAGAADASYTYSTNWSDISVVNAARNIDAGGNNVGNMSFDEIRVGTEAADMFAAIVPAPAALPAGLAMLAFAATRRRRH